MLPNRTGMRPLNIRKTLDTAPAVNEARVAAEYFEDSGESSKKVERAISGILSNDLKSATEYLKILQKQLEDPPEALKSQGDRLIVNVTTKMFSTFEDLKIQEDSPDHIRLAKHLVQTCNAFIDQPSLASSLSAETTRLLLEELNLRLLQSAETPVLKDLSRFINMIILRLFTLGDLNKIYAALFDLLASSVSYSGGKGSAEAAMQARLPELVLKCTMKLARNIKEDLKSGAVQAERLLTTLETFLQRITPSDWKQRVAEDVPLGDMPLRTVKFLIQGLCGASAFFLIELLS